MPMAAQVDSPTTPPPDEDLPGCKVDGDEVCVSLGERQWRVRGWLKNHSADVLKVNVMVTENGKLHVDNLDLYSSRARKFFVADADEELRAGVEALKADIGMVLRMLERLQMRRLKDGQKPKVVVPPMTPEEREAALALLRDDKVCDRIVSDLALCGLVGEDVNKLTAYLGCVSCRLPHRWPSWCRAGRQWEDDADGCGVGVHARGRAREVQRHDGAGALLHG